MNCCVARCSEPPVIHMFVVKANRYLEGIDVCESHAEKYGPFPELARITPSRTGQEMTGSAPFELQFLVFFDRFQKAGIYLRECAGGQLFSFHSGIVETTYLHDLLSHGNDPSDRPFIHAVMASTIRTLGGSLQDIEIDAFENRIFHAKLHIQQEGRQLAIDVRPTDAVALAIIFNAPITIAQRVLRAMGGQD